MIRMNITVPDDLGKELSHVKNKSRFIAEALRDKFTIVRKKTIEEKLEQAYKKSSQEDGHSFKEWDVTCAEGID